MTLDVVNGQNEKVASLELSDALFGGRVKTDLIWQSVICENASRRRGTHKTKNRANVRGSGRKLWKQKGTGRARVSDVRNPLWRKGGTVFGPQPRSYAYALPRKAERAALREALAAKLHEGAVTVVESLSLETPTTKAAADFLSRFGEKGSAFLLIAPQPGPLLIRAFRNLALAHLVSTGDVTPRDIIGAHRLILTRDAIERLQTVIGGEATAPAPVRPDEADADDDAAHVAEDAAPASVPAAPTTEEAAPTEPAE